MVGRGCGLAGIVLCVLLHAASSPCQAASTTPYRPSGEVDKYHRFDFALDKDYGLDIAFKCVVPIVAVGIIFCLVLTIWSCCMCCDNCKPSNTMSKGAKLWLLFAVFLLLVACLAILIYGFRADRTQSDAFQAVPGLIDNLIDWQDTTVSRVDAVTTTVANIATTLNELEGVAGGDAFWNETIGPLLEDANTAANSAADAVDNLVDSANLANIRSKFGDDVDDVDDRRHQIVVAILAVLLVFTILQLGLSAYSMHFTAEWVSYIQWLITFIFLLLIFLTWLICGILYGSTVFFADYCINADVNLLDVTNLDTNDVASYFVRCDDTSLGLTNPLLGDRVDLNNALNDARQHVLDINASIPACGGDATCEEVQAKVDTLLTQSATAISQVGDVFDQTDCEALNGLYQALTNTLCEDGFESLRRFFEVLIALGCFMVIAEILRRMLPRKHENQVVDAGIDGHETFAMNEKYSADEAQA